MATVHGGSVVKSSHWGELTPAEQAAARKALSGLSGKDWSHGSGTDTFAGGGSQGGHTASFSSDTVHGGNVFASGSKFGVSLSSDPFKTTGPTAQAVKTEQSTGSGHVVTLNDHTTVNLIGITKGTGHN